MRGKPDITVKLYRSPDAKWRVKVERKNTGDLSVFQPLGVGALLVLLRRLLSD